VRLGEAFGNVKFLGPARRSSSDPELREFVPLGVTVEASGGRIESVFVVPIPDEHFGVEPYTGTVTVNGLRVPTAAKGFEAPAEVLIAAGRKPD